MNEVPDRRPRRAASCTASRASPTSILAWRARSSGSPAECVRRWPGSRQRLLDGRRSSGPERHDGAQPASRVRDARLVRHYEVEYAVPYGARLGSAGPARRDASRGTPSRRCFRRGAVHRCGRHSAQHVAGARTCAYIACACGRARVTTGALRSAARTCSRGWTGRPHWASCTRCRAASCGGGIHAGTEFQAARAALDPAGVFENGYLRRLLGPRPALPRLRRHDALSARHRHRRIAAASEGDGAGCWSAAVPV